MCPDLALVLGDGVASVFRLSTRSMKFCFDFHVHMFMYMWRYNSLNSPPSSLPFVVTVKFVSMPVSTFKKPWITTNEWVETPPIAQNVSNRLNTCAEQRTETIALAVIKD